MSSKYMTINNETKIGTITNTYTAKEPNAVTSQKIEVTNENHITLKTN